MEFYKLFFIIYKIRVKKLIIKENKKELLRERTKNKYRELSEEEKNIKREYGKKKDIIISLKKIRKN